MKHILQPGDGEVLKLGPPCAGDVVIKVDPQQAGGAFVTGTQTLSPGTEIPVHRHLQADRALFIHKGQGRALVDQQVMTVLPGMTLFVPRNAWHSLRNTGTGGFQVVWIAVPAGIERFFHELAQAGGPIDAASFQQIAQRHGIELQAPGAAAQAIAAAPSRGRHRRRRRGGTGRGRGGQPAVPPAPTPPASAVPSAGPVPVAPVPVTPSTSTPQPADASGRPRHRRRHRGGRGRRGGAQPSAAAPSTAAPAPSAPQPKPAPKPPRGSSPAPAEPRRRGGGGYRRRVKEVYMGGKWVKVEGEGPVISTD